MSHKLRSLIVVAACASALSAQFSQYTVLNGAQEVPPVATPATAVARSAFTGFDTFTYTVKATGLSGVVTGAHVHLGAAGVNGGIAFALTQLPGVDEFKGTISGLTGPQRVALLTDGAYFNIHTQAFPLGEIRGQILGVRRSRFTVAATGGQVVPAVASGASGMGEFWLHEPENVLTYDLDCTGLPPAASAQIRAGAIGVNGTLVEGMTGSGNDYCGVTTALSAANVALLKSGSLYAIVATPSFPAGEIRGQITRATELFTAFATGSEEVPANASAHTACGTFVLNANGSVTYSITTTMPGLSGMHLHTGAFGQNGGVAVGLAGTPPTMTGTTAVLSTTIQDNLRRGNLYLNLHSPTFPSGEIRGQARASADPFGFGSPDGSGGAPKIGGSGYAAPGSTFSVKLFDAAAGANCFLWVGTSDVFWPAGGIPLPFDASIIGGTCAFVWTDWDPTFFFTAVTDPLGCATFPISVPALPAFECLRVMFQWFIVDPNANAFGHSVSDAILVRTAKATLPF